MYSIHIYVKHKTLPSFKPLIPAVRQCNTVKQKNIHSKKAFLQTAGLTNSPG